MAVVTSGTLLLSLAALIKNAVSTAVEAQNKINKAYQVDLTTGTSQNQFDVGYDNSGSIAASGNQDFDFVGALTDRLGTTISALKVIALLVINTSTTAGIDLKVGNGGSNEWTSWKGAAGDYVTVRSTGAMVIVAPNDGYSLVNGASDSLRLTNASGSSACTWELYMLGRTA